MDDEADAHVNYRDILKTLPGVLCLPGFLSGREALEQIPQLPLKPDLVFMDLRLGDMSGVDCLIKLKAHLPGATFMIITGMPPGEEIGPALRAGARGYILKTDGLDAIVSAIKAYREGHPWISLGAEWALIDSMPEEDRLRREKFQLTAMEWIILDKLFRGMRRKEVADNLQIAESTVHVHCRNAFGKLGVHRLKAAKAKWGWKQ